MRTGKFWISPVIHMTGIMLILSMLVFLLLENQAIFIYVLYGNMKKMGKIITEKLLSCLKKDLAEQTSTSFWILSAPYRCRF